MLAAAISTLLMGTASAQFEAGDFQLVPELSQFNNRGPAHDLVVEARLRMAPDASVGVLEVVATMNPSWHLYSLTQSAGGPMRTTIQLAPSDDYQRLGSFAPQRPPEVHFDRIFEMEVEEFTGEVTWSVPIRWVGSGSPVIRGYLEGQVCAEGGACVPVGKDETSFEATPASPALTTAEVQAITGFRLDGTHSPIRSWLSTAQPQPGKTVQLHVAFTPDPDWHVYAYAQLPPSLFQRPTLIHIQPPAGWTTGPAKTAAPIISEESPLPGDPPIRYYDGPVTISVPIAIPEDASPGSYQLTGHVAFQTCAKQCDAPTAVAWQAELTVASQPPSPSLLASVALQRQPSDYDAVVDQLKAQGGGAEVPASRPVRGDDESTQTSPAVASIDELQVQGEENPERSLLAILGFAFLGGFILNFMPCVLPVIGLKIMSFVDQAGASRLRVFGLNAWYAFGMLTVFWVLAVLAAAPALGLSENGFGWGQQFNYQGFAIPLVCLVFVMGLSFLGVWEIPIPGFATGHHASALADKEGYSGAFFKGAITTVLATPCSAPGLATAYGWAVQTRSVTMAFLVFTVMGLGMAIPYLIIGLFPSLVRFIPKPGAWMDTFKQLMGFVLLGTVIFLMQNVAWSLLLPTISMLFGLWFACWWIGRVPLTAEPAQRRRAWAIAVVIGLLTATLSFGRSVDAFGKSFRGIRGWAEQKFDLEVDRLMSLRGSVAPGERRQEPHSANELPWEPFSQALLDDLRASQTTVLIDFTADW